MSDHKNKIRILARSVFPKKRVLRMIKLRKEASGRDYYRVYLTGNRTCILMAINDLDHDPTQVERIEEATEVFSAYRIQVPKIYRYFPDDRMMVIKDLGNVSLENFFTRFGGKRTTNLYRRILDELLKVHNSPVPDTVRSRLPFRTRFVPDKFFHELEFFMTHSGLGADWSETEHSDVKALFSEIAARLCELPFVLTHRDLHSRNILVLDSSFGWVDHQDARLGPIHYDLVSLIKDSYVNIPQKMEIDLVSYYINQSRQVWGCNIDFDSFFEGYYLCQYQRCLKAAGTFFYQSCVQNNRKYQRWIPIALSNAIEAGDKIKLSPSLVGWLNKELRQFLQACRE